MFFLFLKFNYIGKVKCSGKAYNILVHMFSHINFSQPRKGDIEVILSEHIC